MEQVLLELSYDDHMFRAFTYSKRNIPPMIAVSWYSFLVRRGCDNEVESWLQQAYNLRPVIHKIIPIEIKPRSGNLYEALY